MDIDLRELSRDEQTEAICIAAIMQNPDQFVFVYLGGLAEVGRRVAWSTGDCEDGL